jgi:Xaa-Pro aminopeptidase
MDYGTMGVDWEQRVDFRRLREERLAKARVAMASSDLDFMFVTRYEDIRYLTGFRYHLGPTPAVGGAIAVLAHDGELVLYTGDIGFARVQMPWLDHEKLFPRPNLREVPGTTAWVRDVKKLFSGLDADGAKIGVDFWTPTWEANFREVLPKADFVDGYPTLMKAKIIKTEDEIACLELATSITEAGMHAALKVLEAGVRECEVLAAAWHKMTALGSEWTQCANIVTSGPWTAPYRRLTSDRIIREGDLVIIDIGGCYNGYWGDFTRTWICGNVGPTDQQIEYHQSCYDSLFASCAAAKPGNTNADMFDAAGDNVLGNSLGHGSGTSPWEPPFFSSHSKDDPTVLEPNMVMNIEPYAGEPGIGGFRLENNLVVEQDGPRIYTTFPFEKRLVEKVHELDKTTGRT